MADDKIKNAEAGTPSILSIRSLQKSFGSLSVLRDISLTVDQGETVAIIGRKAIEAAGDPQAKRDEMIAEYNDKFMNPYVAAEHGYVDAVILPEETRRCIARALSMLEGKRRRIPDKKHGNIPL